jgi:5-methyltetrahydropteroyltriglutamate--homocysteine methyltransferase
MKPLPPLESLRAEHVGSLLRPPELLQARAAFAAGSLSREELRAEEDRAILGALDLQRQAGLEVLTDGEYRRYSWLTNMQDAVAGFVPDHVEQQVRGGDAPQPHSAQVVGGRLRQTAPLHLHEVRFLQTHAPGRFKITIPSPAMYMIVSYKPGLTDQFYPTREELVTDAQAIIVGEIAALAAAGVPYLQIDAPSYSFCLDEAARQRLATFGFDPAAALELMLAADNACLRAAKQHGVTTAVHVCRGNLRGRWLAQGGYDPVAEQVFNTLETDRFLLEYDTERAGDFGPLRFMPPGKMAVLGLVSTKERRLETPDELLRRIEAAARYVAPEQLALTTACGFATVSEGHPLSPEDQQRKLERVVDVARQAWG